MAVFGEGATGVGNLHYGGFGNFNDKRVQAIQSEVGETDVHIEDSDIEYFKSFYESMPNITKNQMKARIFDANGKRFRTIEIRLMEEKTGITLRKSNSEVKAEEERIRQMRLQR